MPFKEPSGTLFNLMNLQTGHKLDKVQQLMNLNVGDVNPDTAAGSTIALIEQGSKSFSAIRKDLLMLKDKSLNY